MEAILYKNKTVQEYFENPSLVKKDFNVQLAKKIAQRMDELRSLPTVYDLLNCGIDNPHLLIGDLDGCIGWDLTGPTRVILRAADGFSEDFMSKCKDIKTIEVEGVRDYHGGNKKWIIN